MSTTIQYAVFFFPHNSRSHKRGPMAFTAALAVEKFLAKYTPEEAGRLSLGRRSEATGVFLVHEDKEAIASLKEAGYFISHAQSGR